VWPASFVLRNAWQSLRRGIINQDVLAASAAVGGLVGGATAPIWPAFPADAIFGATTFILAFHCVGGFASILVHDRTSQSVRNLSEWRPEQATPLDANAQEEARSVD